MQKLITLFFFTLLASASFAQDADDEAIDYTPIQAPFHPILRLGVYYNPVFATSRVRKTDFKGARESRKAYVPWTWGMSVRMDFRKFALESGAGVMERTLHFTSRSRQPVDMQEIEVDYKTTSLDIPLICHFLVIRPDSKTVFSPYAGTSFNLTNFNGSSRYTNLTQASTTDNAGLIGVSSSSTLSERKLGLSFILGVSMMRRVKKLGMFEFGLSYQGDFRSLPLIRSSYQFNYADSVQADRAYKYTFKTVNQGIRFRIVYHFLNKELKKKPPLPEVPAPSDSSLLKPQGFHRVEP